MVSRRQLLKGILSHRATEIYPPWAISADRFVKSCTRCENCIKICPQHVLKKNGAGFPVMDFYESGCTFCARCAEVCEPESLSLKEFIGVEPWSIKAYINDHCVNYQGTICQMCLSGCDDNAMKFCVQKGGVTVPEIDPDMCTGCGECFRFCPKQAIDFRAI